MNSTSIPPIAIVGLGNVLLGDDAIGCLAVEAFSNEYECGPDVEVIDLGAPGLDLAPYLYGRDLVVVVDAVTGDGQPGTVRAYTESEFIRSPAQLRMTGHEPGLYEALSQLRLVDRAPREVIIVGVIPDSCYFGDAIAPPVLAARSVIVSCIVRLLRDRGFRCERRQDGGKASTELCNRRNEGVGASATPKLR